MKYPKFFTLVDREHGHEVEATYDDVKKEYVMVYGNGKSTTHTESTVTRLIEWCYDLVEHSQKVLTFPDSFQFTHDTTSQLYEMTKLKHHNLWACTQPGLQCVGSGATYTAEEIAGHFARGTWKEISFAEAKDAEPDEPELITPFVVLNVANEDEPENYMTVNKYGDVYGTGHDWTWNEAQCRKFIKDGTWIVKSVGPQKPAEPPTSTPKPLVISVQSEQLELATERAMALAAAVESVNVSLESFYNILKDFNVNVEISPKEVG